MKKVLLTIVFTVLTMSTAIFAQELTVVIAPFNVRAGFSAEDSETIYELFLMEMAKHRSATLKVLDQRDRALGEIINRMEFENSYWSDTKKVTEFGIAANANAVVMGTMMVLGNQRIITGQILDVRTTEILSTSRMDLQNVNEVLVKLPEFTKEIASHLPKPPPVNPLVGRWKATKSFRNETGPLTYILNIKADGTIASERYELGRMTYYSKNRINYSISTTYVSGKYTYVDEGNRIRADIILNRDSGGYLRNEQYRTIYIEKSNPNKFQVQLFTNYNHIVKKETTRSESLLVFEKMTN